MSVFSAYRSQQVRGERMWEGTWSDSGSTFEWVQYRGQALVVRWGVLFSVWVLEQDVPAWPFSRLVGGGLMRAALGAEGRGRGRDVQHMKRTWWGRFRSSDRRN